MHLKIIGQMPGLPGFSMIFQDGVMVCAPAGVNLHAFLMEDLGQDERYIRERISTVFLDGSPVDNLETAQLTAGCTIALSGAMPGLAGVILRRGTPLAAMRSQGFKGRPAEPDPGTTMTVRVRLFNLLIEELGPVFLSRGIEVETGRLRFFIEEANLPSDTRYVLNGEPVSREDLLAGIKGSDETSIFLSVLSRPESNARPREGT